MIPLQEIDIHTDKNVFYKIHLIHPYNASFYAAEILVYDAELDPPYHSTVNLTQQFQEPGVSFNSAIRWISNYSEAHGYTINRIDNPCNTEFLSRADQQNFVNDLGLQITVQENGQ